NREHLLQAAALALATTLVKGLLRQVDEAGIERLQFIWYLGQLALGGHLAPYLHQGWHKGTQPGGGQEVLRAQLRGRGPFAVGGRQQALVLITDRFVRKLHGAFRKRSRLSETAASGNDPEPAESLSSNIGQDQRQTPSFCRNLSPQPIFPPRTQGRACTVRGPLGTLLT